MRTLGSGIAMIFLFSAICAQEPPDLPPVSFPVEEVRLHLTQTHLFAGEILGFSVYCTNPLFPALELSRMVFVEVVSDQNASVLRKKVLLSGGAGKGELLLPDDLKSGIYIVMAYTHWLKNFGESFFHRQSIMIINPEGEWVQLADSKPKLPVDADFRVNERSSDGIRILPDKTGYATREKVSIEIEGMEEMGWQAGGIFSLSVSLDEPAIPGHSSVSYPRRKEILKDEIEYLPDFDGIRVSGRLNDPSGSPIAGGRIIISQPGPGTQINSTLTDIDGNFHFLLPPREGMMDLVLTLPQDDAVIRLEDPYWNGLREPSSQVPFRLDSATISFLESRYSYYQIQQKFNQMNFIKQQGQAEMLKDEDTFYTHYRRLIRIEDYVLLDSLPEYFYELLPAVRLLRNRNEYEIKVEDRLSNSYYEENPGVFIDGVLYSDYNQLAAIPVSELEKISILPELYYYRSFSFGGIVDLHTKKSDFTSVPLLPNMTRLIFPLASNAEMLYVARDHEGSNTLTRIPDYRNLICWKQDIRPGEAGENTIHFYTGDISGTFVVKVCGLSPDGRIVYSEKKIRVKSDHADRRQ